MQHQRKLSGQTFFLALITIMALLLMVIMNTYAIDVAAQTPLEVDLTVNKTANVSTITSGGYVTYIITIVNNGTDDADLVLFRDNYPTGQMSDVSFDFSQPATSDGHTPPEWWFDDPILAGQTAVVTVTGQLVAVPGTVIENTAVVTAFGETNPADNTDEASVTISGGSGSTILYLPIIFKAPPRVLLYSDNFSDDDSGWPDNVNTDICDIEYADNEYRVKVYEDETCWIPGPSVTEYVYAEYQISARVSTGDGNFGYGIYINGAGGNYYYLFRVKPDDECGWRLVRKGNGDETDSGGCHSAINRGSAKNNLKIIHYRDGKISVYVNDTLIHTEDDGANDLDGGTDMGLYVSGANDRDVTVRFDDLRIYSVP